MRGVAVYARVRVRPFPRVPASPCLRVSLFPRVPASPRRRVAIALLPCLILIGWLTLPAIPREVEDFTFLHCSDVHTPVPGSPETIRHMRDIGTIRLAPYNVTATAPQFVIVTGDLTEYGGGYPRDTWWNEYLGNWKDFTIPIFHVSGNHDATWDCLRDRIRKLHGQAYYSFDHGGCHFIALDTATPQDPRPSVGEEEILWLREDLQKVKADTPVFVYSHHTLGGSEFASQYDRDRVLDALRGHNVAAFLVGHGHSAIHQKVSDIDAVMGGSTFGNASGFNVVSISDKILRVAYKRLSEAEASKGLLEKPLFPPRKDPVIAIDLVPPPPSFDGEAVSRPPLHIVATVSADVSPVSASYEIDDTISGKLETAVFGATGTVSTDQLVPGIHTLRVRFDDRDGRFHHRTTTFTIASPRFKWRRHLGGSSKSTPTISDGIVYVGANDGKLYALDANTGIERWSYQTAGDVLCSPVIHAGAVMFGSGDGKFYCLDLAGTLRWSTAVGGPVFSSPIIENGIVFFGCNDGKMYALNASNGEIHWVCDAPKYSIESKPAIAEGRLYFGAWDTFVYAVDTKDGSLIWKAVGEGSTTAKAAHKYYSPADCGPVVCDGKVFIADRAYKLTILDAQTGNRLGSIDRVSATGTSEDGKHVYLRRTNGELTKIDSAGTVMWSVAASMSALPTAPVENDDVVYACSSTGLLSALSAADGKLLWQYQVTPKLYVFSSVAVSDGTLYTSGMDGYVTALAQSNPSPERKRGVTTG